MAVSTILQTNAFERVLQHFKNNLTPDEAKDFQFTKLHDLHVEIETIQQNHASARKLRNMKRLEKFLEAMEQYGKVVEIFLNCTPMLAYVWGPMKFILQVASTYSDSFNSLLDAYEQLGENMPQLLQYQTMDKDPQMAKVLSLLFEDILDFHLQALKQFRQRMWKKIFHATWKTFRSDFDHILQNIKRHNNLIKNQANLIHFERTQEAFEKAHEERSKAEEERRSRTEAENRRRYLAVQEWLSPAPFEQDLEKYSSVRASCPGTGRWLLDNDRFKSWFHPDCCSTRLLWISGKPGAGKTVLASLIVEESQSMPQIKVGYFFCKYRNEHQNTFLAIAKGILAQILQQNRELLVPFLYEEMCTRGGPTLRTKALVKDLLETGLKICDKVYLIIDGIDECDRDERKVIVSWFCELVESLPINQAGKIRCLFISQDDGCARRDFSEVSSLKITTADNSRDIRTYCVARGLELQRRFKLTDERMNEIVDQIVQRADGMFLFAKLVVENLCDQLTLEALDEEIDPSIFPRELKQAYERITDRVLKNGPRTHSKQASQLLGWLICAKRPLKWYEIQGAISIDFENGDVCWERRRLLVDAKELCGSLVEISPNQAVELVHRTARDYLLEEGYIREASEQLQFAIICIEYLCLEGFEVNLSTTDIENMIQRGYYSFMEYAVASWTSHTENAIESSENDITTLDTFKESIQVFLDLHWTGSDGEIAVSSTTERRLQPLKQEPLFKQLSQAVDAHRSRLYLYGKTVTNGEVLDLSQILMKIRERVESLASQNCPESGVIQGKLLEYYGPNWFKCSKMNCVYFHVGFSTESKRRQHEQKHDRPFFCTSEGCHIATFGCATEKELKSHMLDYHGIGSENEYEFPSAAKRKKKSTSYKCQICKSSFARTQNLRAHMRTHTNDRTRPHKCAHCDKTFERVSDCNRHEKLHDEKQFACCGLLKNGTNWGCGRTFPRTDGLDRHWKTKKGSECIRPLREEEEALKSGKAAHILDSDSLSLAPFLEPPVELRPSASPF